MSMMMKRLLMILIKHTSIADRESHGDSICSSINSVDVRCKPAN